MTSFEIDEQVRKVVSTLLVSRESEEGYIVSLPTLYPSGAPVQVRTNFDGNTFFVSDMGQAFAEAELLGASQRVFQNQAREVASDSGILFDNHMFFSISVSPERLSGAIKVVGSASQKAAMLTENQMAEQKDTSVREDFIAALYETFGKTNIDTEVAIKGSSTHSWNFAARLKTSNGITLFDTSTISPNSVFSAHAKFSDIKLLEVPPRGVIGIPSFKEMKADYRNLLQQVANVVEVGSDRSVLKRVG